MTDSKSSRDRRPFSERLKDSVLRGTERARALIQRVRAAVGADTGAYPEEARAPEHAAVGSAGQNVATNPDKPTGPREGTSVGGQTASAVPTSPGAVSTPSSTAASSPTAGVLAGSSDVLIGVGSSWSRWEVPGEFVTLTMAHILMRQSRFRDARRVLDRLSVLHPGDPQIRATAARCDELAKAQGIVSQGVPDSAAPVSDEPTSMLDRAPPPRNYGRDEIRTLPVDPVTVAIFWELTDSTLQRARRDFDGTSHLAILVLSRVPTGGAERREARWIDWVPNVGDYFVRGLPAGARHEVALGLRGTDGSFTPIVQAESSDTPRGRSSSFVADVTATVQLPREQEPQSTTRIVEVRAPDGASLPVGFGVEETLLAWAALGRGMPPAFQAYEQMIASQRSREPARSEGWRPTADGFGGERFAGSGDASPVEETQWEWVPTEEWTGESTSSGQWRRTRSRVVNLPEGEWSVPAFDWPSSPGGPFGSASPA